MQSYALHAVPAENPANSLNAQRSDEYGLDPWGLRAVELKRSQPFAWLIQHSTLNRGDIDFTALDTANPDNPQEVPSRIFIIWLGSAFDQGLAGMRNIVKGWRQNNARHCITLVTDQLTAVNYQELLATNEHAADMVKWCEAQQVCIVDYRDVVSSHPLLEQGLLSKNYGFASDVLRLLLLREYGGVYADIDVVAKCLSPAKMLENGFALGRSGLTKLPHTRELMTVNERKYFDMISKLHEASGFKSRPIVQHDRYAFSNDYIMACVNNAAAKDRIDRVLTKLSERVKMPVAELFMQYGLYSFPEPLYPVYDVKVHASSIKDIKMYYTMLTSGPNTLESFRSECDDVGKYESYFLCSWLNQYHSLKQETNAELIKRLVTCLLFDLKGEPSVLRLNRYVQALSRPAIATAIANLLIEHFSQQLLGIERIIVSEYTDTDIADNAEWLSCLESVIGCAQILKAHIKPHLSDVCLGITDVRGVVCHTSYSLQTVLAGMTKSQENAMKIISLITETDVMPQFKASK